MRSSPRAHRLESTLVHSVDLKKRIVTCRADSLSLWSPRFPSWLPECQGHKNNVSAQCQHSCSTAAHAQIQGASGTINERTIAQVFLVPLAAGHLAGEAVLSQALPPVSPPQPALSNHSLLCAHSVLSSPLICL